MIAARDTWCTVKKFKMRAIIIYRYFEIIIRAVLMKCFLNFL